MLVNHIIGLICILLLSYFVYVIIKEGICRILKLYYIAYTGWSIKRKGYKYPDAILALKKLNYIFAKYTLYRLLNL